MAAYSGRSSDISDLVPYSTHDLQLGISVFVDFAKLLGRENDDTMMWYIDRIDESKVGYWFRADVVMWMAHCHLVVGGLDVRVVADVKGGESLWGRFRVAMRKRQGSRWGRLSPFYGG